jgi:hypothetical protein
MSRVWSKPLLDQKRDLDFRFSAQMSRGTSRGCYSPTPLICGRAVANLAPSTRGFFPSLSCRSCRPNPPFAELVRLSRTSIADENARGASAASARRIEETLQPRAAGSTRWLGAVFRVSRAFMVWCHESRGACTNSILAILFFLSDQLLCLAVRVSSPSDCRNVMANLNTG